MKRLLAALVFVLAACSSKSPSQPTPPASPPPSLTGSDTAGTGSAPAGSDTVAPDTHGSASGPGIGQNCGPQDTCAQGLSCVKYYGIAGARGPQFKTCEIKCEKQNEESVCPPNTKCTTIADGPGQVCR